MVLAAPQSGFLRRIYTIRGQVQGVGFRPFVYRCALASAVEGQVGNTSQGVRIEISGPQERLDAFDALLLNTLPPLAHISALEREEQTCPAWPAEHEPVFHIVHSTATTANTGQGANPSPHSQQSHSVLVSPDVAVCANCLADMAHPGNRRHAYAFTNCTDCGPRFTITRALPYDRETTSMACFPLCPECQAEYENPLNRRFHAQPNACPVCGPRLWLMDKNGAEISTAAPLRRAVQALAEGALVAIKGLGGFHLACDAANTQAIGLLRQRKNRPHKALAIMVENVDSARNFAKISPDAAEALCSHQRPIVLCPKLRGPAALPEILAPDTASLGIMLPSTPLHYLLFQQEESLPALVMTSGNHAGDPLCLGNREAIDRLVADYFLCHNRDILIRIDDSVLLPAEMPPALRLDDSVLLPEEMPPALRLDGSVLLPTESPPIFLRRARGYAPSPHAFHPLPPSAGARANHTCILAVGAELKSTFCITRGQEAFVSQHIGDLNHASVLDFFEHSVEHWLKLLEIEPEKVVCDEHPNYLSTLFAQNFAATRGIPLLSVQHHVAHLYSVLEENHCSGPALGLALDGAGLGSDGSIWGGELFFIHPEQNIQQRIGRLRPFLLVGGDLATRHPWRIAEALAQGAEPLFHNWARPWLHHAGAQLGPVQALLSHQHLCATTSSCGRLFDAVSAACGLCFSTSYEGQAAVLLEQAQAPLAFPSQSLPVEEKLQALVGPHFPLFLPPLTHHIHEHLVELDSFALFQAVLQARAHGISVARVASAFHIALAHGLAHMVSLAAQNLPSLLSCPLPSPLAPSLAVGLSGGVFNNRTLSQLLPLALRQNGFTPLSHCHYPPGDGGLSLGQAAWCRWLKP